jgi:hypothetical protein
MEGRIEVPFVRKRNEDATIQSYCSRCFATVTDSANAVTLEEAEKEHKCDPRLLEMVERYRKVSHLSAA